jgi:hypothetical protein
MRLPLWLLAVCVTVSLLQTSAQASILSTSSGVIVLDPPPLSVEHGVLLSDTDIYVFQERIALILPSDLTVNTSQPGTYSSFSQLVSNVIPAGSTINSYLFHADEVTTVDEVRAYQLRSVTFTPEEHVVGLIVSTNLLRLSDPAAGFPGTGYPTGSSGISGLEMLPYQPEPWPDGVQLSNDLQTVTITWAVGIDNHDQMRVITVTTPEPSAFLLAGSALTALFLLRGRTRY